MNSIKRFKKTAIALALVSTAFVGGNAFAQISLAPGGLASGSGLAVSDPNLDGSWIAALNGTSGVAFTSSVVSGHSFGGLFEEYVYNNDVLNPYGEGKLTFWFGFYINSASPTANEINRLTLNGFGNYQTTVAYATDYSKYSAPEYTAVQSIDRSGDGDTMGVSWAGVPGVSLGKWGSLLVYTDATAYNWNTALLQDGAQASIRVLTPVPEPETYAMLLAGLGLMGFVARRRKQKLATA